jgi:hypothetical protein
MRQKKPGRKNRIAIYFFGSVSAGCGCLLLSLSMPQLQWQFLGIIFSMFSVVSLFVLMVKTYERRLLLFSRPLAFLFAC